ncbi:L-lactate dehydrogenase complex protein LldE [Desulfatibacillum alkenivorans DSM 16219]|uniref:L-lactate dehydrogenase complex protein LldE n=1 Tax=Desulfatibacillum alkenivorans DSM 16219 TaxID=1121393 RepID=A0A1M6L1N7_9BACT|nr:(Fe-S)-binding protein [Desulfatibacillum alkenivorans]SHJ65098.1 L-lactate dehydrogenase complex protein LldE [Desulfatibacillum alkenivorans DSM 16219]
MTPISLHIPCLMNMFMPKTGKSVVRLLERLDIPFVYHEEQTCCGLPASNAGFLPEARKVAKHFLEVFGDDPVVVSPSGSCVEMITQRYPALFEDEPEWKARARDMASKTYEFTQYLVDVLGVEDTGATFSGKVAYHESCSLLRGLGVSEQPKKLIASVKGAELVPMQNADVCCGFGGEFSHKYSEISETMVQEKVTNFINSGADVLVMGEPGCLLNISGYVSRNHPGRKVMHIADLLAGPTDS